MNQRILAVGRITGDSVTIVTEADIFAEFAEAPELKSPLRTEIAEQVLAMEDEAFAEWAGLEASEYEEALDETLFWSRGQW